MRFETIVKKYTDCKTAEQKYKFTTSLRKALRQCEESNRENLEYCPNCKKHVYKQDLIEKYEFWTESVCTNPFGGYLDDYQYEDREISGFIIYCPLCHKKIGKKKWN